MPPLVAPPRPVIQDKSIRAAFRAAGATINRDEAEAIWRAALDVEKGDRKKGQVIKDGRIDKGEKAALLEILAKGRFEPGAKAWLQTQIAARAAQTKAKSKDRRLKGAELRAVARVVSGQGNVQNIRFTDPEYGISYVPGKYKAVAEMIRGGEIAVYEYAYEEDALKGNGDQALGLYRSAGNRLSIQQKGQRNFPVRYESTLVHEATHAIQDMTGLRMHRHALEAAAHIAQAVMLLTNGHRDGSALYNDRLKPARAAAEQILAGEALSKANYEKVRNSAAMAESYPAYDGKKNYERDFGADAGSWWEELKWAVRT
jgi:hypothetical protein